MACAKVKTQMFMPITEIDLFDHNVGMACAKVRLRSMHTTVINLFDHSLGKACTKVRLRCPCISLVLIYLITMWVWHVPKLDLDVQSYLCY